MSLTAKAKIRRKTHLYVIFIEKNPKKFLIFDMNNSKNLVQKANAGHNQRRNT